MLVLVFVQDACVLVYDITNADSFEHIKTWHATFLEQLQLDSNTKYPFLLCGNKSDLQSNRVVSQQDGESLANQLGMLFIETNDLNGNHFDTAMRKLIKTACAVDTDKFTDLSFFFFFLVSNGICVINNVYVHIYVYIYSQLQKEDSINIDVELTKIKKQHACCFF
ncbi:rab family small GTPase [Reticulomyxa filosa]|uniref:Rab family small GTPase n=1 Tax=Reticulomyxa filosa TaxID=46433 RepID=X6MGG2_RETFI|nr:rab family small GTPase [Reticulomyxa filosa]|eukprot:ETO12140.1 rab family small GTPase [Reticulomyxa filosa]